MTTLDDVKVDVAFCPMHGLHGKRDDCFECGNPCQQIPMVPLKMVEREVLKGRLIELDLLEQALNARMDISEFKLDRLFKLETLYDLASKN
jgi:hypothetical protein